MSRRNDRQRAVESIDHCGHRFGELDVEEVGVRPILTSACSRHPVLPPGVGAGRRVAAPSGRPKNEATVAINPPNGVDPYRATSRTLRATRVLTQTLAFSAALIFATGCGDEGQIPDSGDKERVSTAALTIAAECIASGTRADTSTIEDQVTALVAEADEAGEARFTLSKTFSNVTMADILRDRARFMREHDCAPEQADRLDEAEAGP